MRGWLGGEENSSGQLDWRLAAVLPVQWRQLGHLLVGRCRQSLQHIFEVGVRFDAVHPAVLDQRVNHRAALARFFGAEKQPVRRPIWFIIQPAVLGACALASKKPRRAWAQQPKSFKSSFPLAKAG